MQKNQSNKRPVWMRGETGTAGHAWVCDGFEQRLEKREYNIYYIENMGGSYSYDSDGRTYTDVGNTWLGQHLNWGQGTYGHNGWYNNDPSQSINGATDYKYDRKNLYIYPIK